MPPQSMSISAATPCNLPCDPSAHPSRPITLVNGFAPGGNADLVARLVAQKMTEQVGQTIVVENRPGAGGAIATERVVTAPADGYTLLMMTAADTALPALRTKLPYSLERDLAPVAMVAVSPFVVVVHPSVPARNVKELIALAKTRPGQIRYATSGIGGFNHFGGELFNMIAGIKLAHKDIFCTTGVKTSCGSKMLDNFVAPYDATVVEKLMHAGVVMLGKTNMDEFAMGSSNETSFFGPVRNPWNTETVPGGSSGGSAAAVAARLAAKPNARSCAMRKSRSASGSRA